MALCFALRNILYSLDSWLVLNVNYYYLLLPLSSLPSIIKKCNENEMDYLLFKTVRASQCPDPRNMKLFKLYLSRLAVESYYKCLGCILYNYSRVSLVVCFLEFMFSYIGVEVTFFNPS